MKSEDVVIVEDLELEEVDVDELLHGTLMRRVVGQADDGVNQMVELVWLPNDGQPALQTTTENDINEREMWLVWLNNPALDSAAGLSILHIGGEDDQPYFTWLPYDPAQAPVRRTLDAPPPPAANVPASGRPEYDQCRQQKMNAGVSALKAGVDCLALIWE